MRVALDDFGSGFNSLKHLHALPLDLIKLDAGLTSGDAEPARTEALCRSVLVICDQMRLTAVAEGIENEQQALTFKRLGCHLAQGYHFGMPMSLSESQRRTGDRAGGQRGSHVL